MKIHHSIVIFLFVISLFSISGCGLWGDFTTYFNLYYNAKDLFSQAEDDINSQQTELFSTVENPIPGSVTINLNKVIDKCSQILQFHAESAYVDDALLMLGKSFYYQRIYLKALRKFQELVATQPNSSLILETNLWIGKTQMRLRQYDDAVKTLEDVRTEAQKEGRDEILRDAFIEEIKYRISLNDYPGAIGLMTDFLKFSGDGEINAQVMYELGLLYLKQNDLPNAIVSFRKVEDYSPTYETQFNAKLELGKALRESGKKDDALAVFDGMKSESKNKDSYDEIDLQRGITLDSMQLYYDAIHTLINVDTTYPNTVSAGIAKYELGNIYLENIINYDSASIYFNSALNSKISAEYLPETRQKVELFKRFFRTKSNINNNNKMLFYLQNPEQYKEDSTKYMTDSLNYVKDSLREYEDYERYEELVKTLSSFDTTKTIDSVALRDSLSIIDSLLAIDSTVSKDSLSSWYTHTKQKKDQLEKEKQQQLVQNNPPKNPPGKKIKILKPKLYKPIRPDIPEDSIKKNIVQNELVFGNLYLTEFNIPDSAFYYYMDIINNYPGSPYTARTLYALGSYYLTQNQNQTADSLFNIIYNNYQTESIVNAAADKLNKPLIDFNYDPARDLYKVAEKEFLDSNYQNSMVKFENIYKSHPSSPFAPKALYASGWIMENQLGLLDSAAALYDTIVTKYPKSIYANNVRVKLLYYQQEKARIKKQIEDSLKALEKMRLDSIAVQDSLKNANANNINEGGKEELKGKNTQSQTNSTAQDSTLKEEYRKNKNELNNKVKEDENFRRLDSLKNKSQPDSLNNPGNKKRIIK